jgi:hypothetical protein
VNPRNIWPAIVLALGGMAAVGGMAVMHVDRDLILLCIASFVTPVLGGLLVGQIAENRAATQAVQQQTNGNQSRMMDILERFGDKLAASTPAPPTAIPDPTPPAPPEGGPPA